MNSRKLLVTSLFVAIMMIGVAIIYAKTKGPQPGDESTKVTIERAMAVCGAQDQCIMVDTKCNFCCDFVAINAKYETAYNKLFDDTCGTFSIKHCKNCDNALTARPRCVSGTCQMVKWGEEPPALTFRPAAPTPAPAPAPVLPQTQRAAPVPANPAPPPEEPESLTEDLNKPFTAPLAPRTPTYGGTDAFGEDEPFDAPAPVDDLNAPITEDERPYSSQDQADVIRP